jgi:hypothetical protein
MIPLAITTGMAVKTIHPRRVTRKRLDRVKAAVLGRREGMEDRPLASERYLTGRGATQWSPKVVLATQEEAGGISQAR